MSLPPPVPRCEARGCDDDVQCCMEVVEAADLLPATATSLRCLAADVGACTDVESAARALCKHDRYVYLAAAVVAAVVLVGLVRAVLPRRPQWEPHRGPVRHWRH